MNLLILGSEGFIGKHLVNFYSNKGNFVHGADLFETSSQIYFYHKISRLSPEVEELLNSEKFDFCINAAGSGNVAYSMTHPTIDFEANSLDTMRILDGLRRYQPNCRYVHISSAAVYGNPNKIPVAETDKLGPLSPYGWHKLIAEHICKEFYEIYRVPIAIVRPFSVFGPGLKKQLFWDLHKKLQEVEDKVSIQLFGTGNESRDFIYVDDLVGAIDCIIHSSSFEGDVYNLATGVETTIKDAAEMFVQAFGNSVAVEFNQKERSGDPQNWKADISKITSLGFCPEVTIQEGIRKTTQWLKGLE